MRNQSIGLLLTLVLVLLVGGLAQAQVKDFGDGGDLTRPAELLPIWGDEDDDDDGDGDDDEDLGEHVAGTWLGSGSFSVDLGCDGSFEIGPIFFTDAHTFGAAGSRFAVNPANPNTNGGTWKKTGKREISSRDVSFAVDTTPGGTVTTVAIISAVFSFDKEFANASTVFGAKVYLPTQDPLDPGELPVACSAGSHDSFRKLTATE